MCGERTCHARRLCPADIQPAEHNLRRPVVVGGWFPGPEVIGQCLWAKGFVSGAGQQVREWMVARWFRTFARLIFQVTLADARVVM